MPKLPSIIQDLLHGEAYPHHPKEIELVQTHISYVLLAESFVYKIKKPVNFGFLDFTSLEKRFYFCQREVELNNRLCEGIYLDVVPIVKIANKFYIEKQGPIQEWAVKMKRLPEKGMMTLLIKEKRLSSKHIDLLVKKLVNFYQKAETGPNINKYGELEAISYNIEENFSQTKDYINIAIPEFQYNYIVNWSRNFLQKNSSLFAKRIEEGFIRDGHGDLYSANICFDEEKGNVYIFDCIEFNDRFRCGDVAQDIAFLAMDLDFHDLEELSNYFIEEFVKLSKDKRLKELLPFYKCYRAYVRGKIGCFTWSSPNIKEQEKKKALESASKYFQLAYKYTGGKPYLIVVLGLSGTGKSTLAKALAPRLGAEYYNSDVVRKQLLNIPPEEHRYEPFGQGIYNREITLKTYERLSELALQSLKRGNSVILDATFNQKIYRKILLEKVKNVPHKVVFICCQAPEEEIKKRFKERAKRKGEVSDGRWEIYKKQKTSFEPLDEINYSYLQKIETTKPINKIIRNLLKKL